MKIIIGLVGSGKTTLYRKLNENKILNAVELELPQSCINDKDIKRQLFTILHNSKNIDCIIVHPYYLPDNFFDLIHSYDDIGILNVPFEERIKRIKERSEKLGVTENIFPLEFLLEEEKQFEVFKEKLKQWLKKQNKLPLVL